MQKVPCVTMELIGIKQLKKKSLNFCSDIHNDGWTIDMTHHYRGASFPSQYGFPYSRLFAPSGFRIHKIIENYRWRFGRKKNERKKKFFWLIIFIFFLAHNLFWLLNGNLATAVKGRMLMCESLFRHR